jgi:hypothetical protein
MHHQLVCWGLTRSILAKAVDMRLPYSSYENRAKSVQMLNAASLDFAG